jgi:hypothetical protein
VALAGPLASPVVIDRRILQLADPNVPGSKQPYHAAEPLPFAKAEVLIKTCIDQTRRLAVQGIKSAIHEIQRKGYCIADCAVLLGSGRTLPDLAHILASHALIHAAEGEMYRKLLAQAAEHCGLTVVGIKERELFEQAALHRSRSQIEKHLLQLGRSLGPPWTQDQKVATVAAWIALLASAGNRAGTSASAH